MVKFGRILIIVGFLVGAAAASVHEENVNWFVFTPALAAAALGIGMAQTGLRRLARDHETLTGDLETIEESLAELAKRAAQLEAEKADIDVYDVHSRIDDLFMVLLDRFVQARNSVTHAYSMSDYAHLMNHFAAGERRLNRAWSASVDGYIDEVHACLARAARHFADARDEFQKIKSANRAA